MARLRTLLAAVEQYAATARSHLSRKSKNDSTKRWLAYSSAVGSALALAGSADADIIYSGPQNISVSVKKGGMTTASAAVPIKPSFHQHLFLFNFNSRGSAGTFAGIQFGSFADTNPNGRYVHRLASGQVISAGIPGGWRANANSLRGAFRTSAGQYFQNGNWPATGSGFAGFRFYYGPGKQNHYGWIRLHLHGVGANNLASLATVTAVDWAYENSPNTPIVAGATGAAAVIPEPSSLALAALATGAAGVYALRRRRNRHPSQAGADARQGG